MNYNRFKAKVKAVYPEKDVKFVCTGFGYSARVEGFTFTHAIGSEQVQMFWPDGSSAGRATAVEEASVRE